MSKQTATRLIPGSPDRVRSVLLNPAAIPSWNPAIRSLTGPARAEVGRPYPVVVRGGLRGRLVYTAIADLRIEVEIGVPGLAERSWWRLVPTTSDPAATLVEHGFVHRGPLAVVLSRAFQGVAELRVDRLADRVTSTWA